MNIITAKMARNIANDFLNNACGPTIKEAMSEILRKANQGLHEHTIYFPNDWDSKTRHSVILFFGGLGYETSERVGCVGFDVRW